MKLRHILENAYEDLEDNDKFGRGTEFLGERNIGPHIFRVWYHMDGDLISMDINGYEFSPWEDNLPTAQKEDIVQKTLKLRPDILSQWVGNKSLNGAIMDIGLALVDLATTREDDEIWTPHEA